MEERGLTLLQQMEREVLAEGQEWMRQRLTERLEGLAKEEGEISPLSGRPLVRRRDSAIALESVAGRVEFSAPYGQDPQTGRWLSPTRLRLGLEARQAMTPELEARLCFTATQSLSYEAAAEVAQAWGAPLSISAIYTHVQRCGARQRERDAAQTERALNVETRAQVAAEAARGAGRGEFSLVVMIDAWKIRERGAQWGRKPPEEAAERVEWRDMKTGIVFRLEDRAETQSGRRMVLQKRTVAYRGDPFEFARRLYALALASGLAQARAVYVVADGALWIWNIVQDRFSQAFCLLDYYHAGQHLWAVAHALHADHEQARAWVDPLLHELKHGQHARVLQGLQGLNEILEGLQPEARQTIQREQAYFQSHKSRLAYSQAAKKGCPIGSGAMESTCAQLQDRFKRTGQFWVRSGHANLMALDLARRNKQWKDVWKMTQAA